MTQPALVITGDALTVPDVAAWVTGDGRRVSVCHNALNRTRESRRFLATQLPHRVVYGVNTGFGPMASHLIGSDALDSLQLNVVRSHAAGMGDPIDEPYVLAAMLVRLNSIAKGYSGVSPELLTHLAEFINRRVVPIVPAHGGVGASGDLVQLAHVALALVGEGDVFYGGVRRAAAGVLAELGIQPHRLGFKEGLALINGTSMMTGIGALLCDGAQRLIDVEILNGAWALELVNAYGDSLSARLHGLRPHPGQRLVAERLRSLLASSKRLHDRATLHNGEKPAGDVHQIDASVQDVYSFRCIPQIVGPAVDALRLARDVIETEMNSVTDNPIVDWEQHDLLHGGNFHGDYVAWALDQLKMTLVKLAMLSERRINFLLNHRINRRFPPFLNLDTPGLTLGLQGIQFVATSAAAQSQTLAFPQYVHSIPTNADNQDIVSMGTDAALIAAKVLDNAFVVAAIETAVLAQATECIEDPEMLSTSARGRFDEVRRTFPKVTHDRPLQPDLDRLLHELRKHNPPVSPH